MNVVDNLAARALELAKAELGPAAEIEVLAERERAALTRFANSYIHQNVADESARVTLRVHHDGRTAAANTSRVDDGGLRALATRVAAAARLLPADRLWPGLAPPASATGHGPVDQATAEATPAERAERVKAFVTAADGLAAAGYCGTTHVESAFANSAGHHLAGAYTEAGLRRGRPGRPRVDAGRRGVPVRLEPDRRHRRRGARRPRGRQGAQQRRRGLPAARRVRGGVGARGGRRPARRSRYVLLQRQAVRGAPDVREAGRGAVRPGAVHRGRSVGRRPSVRQ
jgi:hypothetical protein